MGNISFNGIPAGKYVLAITWFDGAANTLKATITLGGEEVMTASGKVEEDAAEAQGQPQIDGETEGEGGEQTPSGDAESASAEVGFTVYGQADTLTIVSGLKVTVATKNYSESGADPFKQDCEESAILGKDEFAIIDFKSENGAKRTRRDING